MVSIVADSVRGTISGLSHSEESSLNWALSYEYRDAFWILPYHSEDWDGRRYLLQEDHSFRIGLLPRVVSFLREHQIPYEVASQIPQYPLSPNEFSWNPELVPRDYQKKAAQKMLRHQRGVLWAVPRSGKTIIAALITRKLGWTPTLLLCESLDIAYQTQSLLENCLQLPVGLIGDGQANIQKINVATIQSCLSACDIRAHESFRQAERRLYRKRPVRETIESSRLIFGDEVHHWAARSYQEVSARFLAAGRIYGLSGTPWRNDNADLVMEQAVGPVIHRISYPEMISGGYLVPPIICFQHIPQVDGSSLSYPTIYKNQVVENALRNQIIQRFARKAEALGLSTLILVSQIKHGKILEKMIGCQGVYGPHSSRIRNQAFEDLRNKRILGLITTLADEGLDIPSLDCEVIAAAGQSSSATLQRMRAMTPYPGKERCFILEFFDHNRFLKCHARTRLQTYLNCGFEVREQTLNQENQSLFSGDGKHGKHRPGDI